jgi:5,10-methylenetetrahydromethanopterin reductase
MNEIFPNLLNSTEYGMDQQSFEIGLMVWIDEPVSTLTELAVEAEKSGFGELWFPDHYFLRDVYITMASIAQRTNTIRLGTAVAAVQLRHPTLIASSALTVNEVSNGRAIIGIGPGGFEFASQLGMHASSPLTMMNEAVTIIRSLLADGCDFKGKYFSAQGSKIAYPTSQIPIHLSARGPKMKELAGEISDGVLIHGINQEYIDYVKERIRVGAERVGRSPSACEIGPIIDIEIDEDEAAAIERLRPKMRIMAGGAWSDSLIPFYKLDPQEVAQLKAAVAAGMADVNHLITDDMVRVFSIAGSRQKVKQELMRLRKNGLRRVVLNLSGTLQQKINHIQNLKPIIEEVCS